MIYENIGIFLYKELSKFVIIMNDALRECSLTKLSYMINLCSCLNQTKSQLVGILIMSANYQRRHASLHYLVDRESGLDKHFGNRVMSLLYGNMQSILLREPGLDHDVNLSIGKHAHAPAPTVKGCNPKSVGALRLLYGVYIQLDVLQQDLEALVVAEGGAKHERRVVDILLYLDLEVQIDLLTRSQVHQLISIVVPDAFFDLVLQLGQP